jgi:hypothetical protein
VLGNGIDFFIPKPKSLRFLAEYIVDNSSSRAVKECVIISNCARFEILLVVDNNDTDKQRQQQQQQQQLLQDVSQSLLTQMEYYYDGGGNVPQWKHALLNLLDNDRPKDVFTCASPTTANITSTPKNNISDYWTVYESSPTVLQYLCKIVCGMSPRPNRPATSRVVVFRPFSSRDAHIILQFKRTKDTIVVTTGSKELAKLFEYALRAGKAVRNTQLVPELKELQQQQTTSRRGLSKTELLKNQQVTRIAYEKAVRPLVEEYIQKYHSKTEQQQRIVSLRQNAHALLEQYNFTDDEQRLHIKQWLNRKLHQPTIEIRRHQCLVSYKDEQTFLQQLQEEFRKEYNISGRKPS